MSQVTPDETARQTAAHWLIKLQSPELTQAQQQDFFTWLDHCPEHQQAYIDAEQLWQSLGSVEQLPNRASPIVDSKFVAKSWYRHPQAIAASLFALAALVLLQLWPYLNVEHYQTSVGEQRLVTLVEGSSIYLNTNSKLQVVLRSDHRLVDLQQGEAFFNVSPDAKRPFIVKTSSGLVRVLGTRFSVRAEALKTTVTVVEGKVAVDSALALDEIFIANYQPQMTLTANQQLVIAASGMGNEPTVIDAAAATTWRQGKQVYNGVPLATVIQDLNRYFAGDVMLGDPSLGSIEVVAVLDLRNRQRAVEALKTTFNLVTVQKSPELTVFYPSEK